MPRVRRSRTVTVALPAETATHGGLAYTLWLPERPPRGGIVVLHGAGSCKENHHDYARAALGAGFAAIVFDQRGHGGGEGPIDGRAASDVVAIAGLLRDRLGGQTAPVALRGSSMGGCLAIVAAAAAGAAAVVAICPAPGHDLSQRLAALSVPVLLLHAEGDEQVPVEHSRELAKLMRSPASRLIAVPGGHHRSIQHDAELQAVSLRFIEQALAR
jgi:uncharacterized protein